MTNSRAFNTLYHAKDDDDREDIEEVEEEEGDEEDGVESKEVKAKSAGEEDDNDKDEHEDYGRQLSLLKEGERFEPHIDKKRWSEAIKDDFRIGDVLFIKSGKARISHEVGLCQCRWSICLFALHMLMWRVLAGRR
jgi:hypothetical protein